MFKSQSAWSDLKWKEIERVRDIGSSFMESRHTQEIPPLWQSRDVTSVGQAEYAI